VVAISLAKEDITEELLDVHQQCKPARMFIGHCQDCTQFAEIITGKTVDGKDYS